MNSRRTFLKNSAYCLGSLAVAGPLQALDGRLALGDSTQIEGFGPLLPTADETTGLKLLRLPEGFRYKTFGWTNQPMSNGHKTPGAHDGMAVILEKDGIATIARNHEVDGKGGSFTSAETTYDPKAGGGCTNLRFDLEHGKWLDATPSISGTVRNCAGGLTPWNTWLTCEETIYGPEKGFEMDHGWIFEVPAEGVASPQPLKAMGRFVHEAVAVDPRTGYVYETEDREECGFYRFIPNSPGKLAAGGKLEMMKLEKREDVRRHVKPGRSFDVTWVGIELPEQAHTPGTDNTAGVFYQGKAQKGVTFARLEGCWYASGLIYLAATNGGNAACGQIWAYDPKEEKLTLIFESPSPAVLDFPDNLTVSPRGGLLLCEDNDHGPQMMFGLTTTGKIFPFAENATELYGVPFEHRGDFRSQEWAGACFSSDGEWLFVNVQTPGFTIAITGPWRVDLI